MGRYLAGFSNAVIDGLAARRSRQHIRISHGDEWV